MKNLLIIVLILFISFSARSSHLMGGEIVVQNDQVGQYEIFLTLYSSLKYNYNLLKIIGLEISFFIKQDA